MLVERDHIGIFGKMNSGKSTIMNLLTPQALRRVLVPWGIGLPYD